MVKIIELGFNDFDTGNKIVVAHFHDTSIDQIKTLIELLYADLWDMYHSMEEIFHSYGLDSYGNYTLDGYSEGYDDSVYEYCDIKIEAIHEEFSRKYPFMRFSSGEFSDVYHKKERDIFYFKEYDTIKTDQWV